MNSEFYQVLIGGIPVYIKPSSALRNEYGTISDLAKESGEPIYITKNGEGDLVLMDIDAFEQREEMWATRVALLEGGLRTAPGEPTYTLEEVREHVLANIHAACGNVNAGAREAACVHG